MENIILGIGRTERSSSQQKERMQVLLDRYSVPEQLKNFYSKISDDEELAVNKFQFCTINEILENYGDVEDVSNDEMISFFCVGYSQMGMGHVCLLVYDPRAEKFYFRHDGGSNGWERESVYRYFEGPKFVPTSVEYADKIMTFDEALQHIVVGDFGKYIIMEN